MESPETAARIAFLRAEAQVRKLTQEEQAEAIRLVRADRVSAGYASKNAKAAAKPKTDPAAALAKIAELMGKKV